MGAERQDERGATTGELRLGRYRVDTVLGTGAFATVYGAVDERLDDTVAVKVLAENHSLDADLRERFLTEGRVLRRVASRHVVTVHDLGETARQQPYLVLEYADRGTLARRVPDLVARGWRPGVADLWAVAAPLAEALDAIHRAGVVHRDVNPTNVLITTRGTHAGDRHAAVTAWDERLVLADLGLCKDLALNSGHTSAGGTEGFRPPELRRGPAMIDGRADLWSLSALLVWLATGAPPGDHPASALLSRTGLPPGLGEALDRSLAVDPAARHPHAAAWWADVAAALSASAVPFAGAAAPAAPLGGHPAASGVRLAGTGAPAAPVAGPANAAPGLDAGALPPVSASAGVGGWPGASLDAGLPIEARGRGWRLRHSGWVLTALPLGLTTWLGFLYVGLSANRRAWKVAAAAYGVAAAAILVLAIISPVGPDGRVDDAAWQSVLGTILLVVTWLGGIGHALVANVGWLRWRSRRAP